jgi:hypothetical protein
VLHGVARGFAEGFYARITWFHVDSFISGRDGEYIFYDIDVPNIDIVVPKCTEAPGLGGEGGGKKY